VRAYWPDQNPQTEAGVRQALTLDAIRWQYLHGVPDQSVVSPDTWHHDAFAGDSLLDGGHFLLESQLDAPASRLRRRR
jgi:hypothetical protein